MILCGASLLLSLFTMGRENQSVQPNLDREAVAEPFFSRRENQSVQPNPFMETTSRTYSNDGDNQLGQLTLEEAVARALSHSPEQKVQQMKTEEARLSLREARLHHVPNVHASGDVRRNLIIPSTPVPAHRFNPDASDGEPMYLKFNTEWNATVGLNLDYDLFSPDKVYATGERAQQLKIQEYEPYLGARNASKGGSCLCRCVIAMEQLRSLESDTAYYSYLLNRADTLFEREKVSLIEKTKHE